VNNGGTLSIGAASTAALGSRIELAGTGKIEAVGAVSFTFTGTGAVLSAIAGNTLRVIRGGSSSAIISTGPGPIPGEGTLLNPYINGLKVSGDITLSSGTLAYTHDIGTGPTIFTNTHLDLTSGSIKAQTGFNAYDTAKLGGTIITKIANGLAITFNGTNGRIILGDTDAIVATGGTLNTGGNGYFQFANANNTLATNAVNLDLPKLSGDGILSGKLELGVGSVLTIGGGASTFKVGGTIDDGSGTATLDVSSGTVNLANANSAIVVGYDGTTTVTGIFTNGSNTNSGNFTIGGTSSFAGIQTENPTVATLLGAQHLSGVLGSPNTTWGAGSSATVAVNTNDITITRGSADNTITSASKLYSHP
jgi:hypothetical protein